MAGGRDRDAPLREVGRVVVSTGPRATRPRAVLERRQGLGRDTAVADGAWRAAEARLEHLDRSRRRLSRAAWPDRP